jgi:Cu-Zn family superoxide dismutase
LIKADGTAAGSISIEEDSNGVTLRLSADRLPRGTHGVHLHEAGRCDAPDFQSAGAHWNPTNRKHGRDNPEGAHFGDFANFAIGEDGSGKGFVTVAATQNALADADGTALVIHADPDDYKTDPSGNSGDRIACAVLAPPR